MNILSNREFHYTASKYFKSEISDKDFQGECTRFHRVADLLERAYEFVLCACSGSGLKGPHNDTSALQQGREFDPW